MKAGIYMLRHPVTGDAYIGASTKLSQRLQAWKSELTKARRKGYYTPRFDGVFEDIDVNDIEMRVLEYVNVPAEERGHPEHRFNPTRSMQKLIEREAFWIAKLKPSLNVKEARKVDLAAIPVGPPEASSC